MQMPPLSGVFAFGCLSTACKERAMLTGNSSNDSQYKLKITAADFRPIGCRLILCLYDAPVGSALLHSPIGIRSCASLVSRLDSSSNGYIPLP